MFISSMIRGILIFSLVTYVTACTFPSDLTGEWQSLSYGTLTFTNTTFSGFTSAIHSTPLTFSCHLNSGTQYVAKYVSLCIISARTLPISLFQLDLLFDSRTGIQRLYHDQLVSLDTSNLILVYGPDDATSLHIA